MAGNGFSDKRLAHRSVSPNDPFLCDVYVSTRADEVALFGWPPTQQQAFLKMQFDARRGSYEVVYPGAAYSVLVDGDTPIGSLIVARGDSEIRLVDIAFLPEHRNRGFGAATISLLIEESVNARLPLRLSVTRGNPAMRLYQRLGFKEKQSDVLYIEMEHDCGV